MVKISFVITIRFRRYNNLYLKHWFLRDSHVHHNTTRKIFETHSRLNLQDAMRLVSKQSLFDLYTNNEKMITPSKSLSALFRTYTQANLSSIQEDIPMKLASLNLPLGSPSEFNFDLANLEYSPSHKDLADAEIHHILNDAMFTPIKRVGSLFFSFFFEFIF